VFNLDYHYGENAGPRLGNFHVLENWNVNVLAQIASGLPYTPQTLSGADLIPQTNSKRYPRTVDVDMRMRRFFNLTTGVRAGVIFEVQNLLNRRDPIGPDNGGIIDRYRDLVGYTNGGTSRTRNYGGFANSAPNPNAWVGGRLIRVGFTTEF
jgi:hypothetical protein